MSAPASKLSGGSRLPPLPYHLDFALVFLPLPDGDRIDGGRWFPTTTLPPIEAESLAVWGCA